MKRILKIHAKRLAFAFVLLFGLGMQAAEAKTALILYDNQPTASFGRLGKAYAIMLSNLLGHFKFDGQIVQVTLQPVESYVAGSVNNYDNVFYMGAYYDNPLPAAFLSDVLATTKPVVWFKNNIWKLAWDPAYSAAFLDKFGFSFDGLVGLNATPSATNTAPGFYDTVVYKGVSLTKYYNYDTTTNTVYSDPETGFTTVRDTTKAQALVWVNNPKLGTTLPYVVKAGNFWYFADTPFSYIGPRDRYLVICDLLHDILGSTQTETHPALVRLEDVGATVSQTAMTDLTNYLAGLKIPFSVATIPYYRDPHGLYNGGAAQQIRFAETAASTLRSSLDYALKNGGSIVMHGYTHQYGGGYLNTLTNQYVFMTDLNNLYTAVSGDDFEFWNIVNNTPVAEDSEAWAQDRLRAGRAELASVLPPADVLAVNPAGYTPFAWETPHYHGSPAASRGFAKEFSTTYQRVVYYTSDDGRNLQPAGNDMLFGQFFPYIIEKDYYGQRVLPENLGNIEYNISTCDVSSFISYGADDLLANADAAKVVRDGYASFFFHPFWLEDLSDCGLPVGTGFADFKKLVEGITQKGYTWIQPSQL
jgi:uncharacterized protein YdaL